MSISEKYPWYDSPWLQSYVRAKEIILECDPALLPDFEEAISVLNAPKDFEVVQLNQVLSVDDLESARTLVGELKPEDLEQHELLQFGRLVAHDHPEFTRLQKLFTSKASEMAGEELEPSYNFLALYNNLGVCSPHLDAPSAKWTLDICLGQSEPWPIHFSQCVSWPERFDTEVGDWTDAIVNNPDLNFSTFAPTENEALFFAGSNQWHYRERIGRNLLQNYCHLLFFHYIPVGSGRLIDPGNWRDIFGISQLSELKHISARN